MTKPISAGRAKLLSDLEFLVGNNCYNPKIQNYGAHGVFHGEGRSIRYPLTTVNEDNEASKIRGKVKADDPKELSTGYYAFGVNRLHIIKALDEVLRHLEENHDLKL